MRLTLVMISPDEVAAIADDEEAFFNLIEDPQPPTGLDVDKAWHGIHYLLTGSIDSTEGPYGRVIFGGEEVGPDLGYGPARALAPAEVQEVSKALQALPPNHLQGHFDPKAMDAAGVYPNVWEREGLEALQWLQSAFDQLRSFYDRAATQQRAVILALL